MIESKLEEYKTETLEGLDEKTALDRLAQIIDGSWEHKFEEGLRHGIVLCEHLRASKPDSMTIALTYYFEANAWESLRQIIRDDSNIEEWEQPEYEKIIVALRKAHHIGQIDSIAPEREAQIATNLANTFRAYP